jgi:hypothetical protein
MLPAAPPVERPELFAMAFGIFFACKDLTIQMKTIPFMG